VQDYPGQEASLAGKAKKEATGHPDRFRRKRHSLSPGLGGYERLTGNLMIENFGEKIKINGGKKNEFT